MRAGRMRLRCLLSLNVVISLTLFVANVSAQNQKKPEEGPVAEKKSGASQGEKKETKATPKKQLEKKPADKPAKDDKADGATNPYLTKSAKPAPQKGANQKRGGAEEAPGKSAEQKPFPHSDALDKAAQRRVTPHPRKHPRKRPRRMMKRKPPRKHGDAGAPFALALAFGTVWNQDPGFNLFSEEESPAWGGMWVSYDMLSLTPQLILAVELGFWIGDADDREPGLDYAYFDYNESRIYVGANLRYVLLPWLQPHARLEAGPSIVKLKSTLMDSGDVEYGLSEDTVSPFASLGLGVTFRTPTRMFETRSGKLSSLSLGLMFEGGYTVASAAGLSMSEESDDDRVETRAADLGEIDLSSPYFKTSIVVRF